MRSVGRHLIMELWGCANLNSLPVVERALRSIVRACEMDLVELRVHPFSPMGVTGVAVVSESHVILHTWPEFGYAAVDVFTCGGDRDPSAALPVLEEHFSPERIDSTEVVRGLVPV